MQGKRKVLFTINHMTIGGIQKSLISALDALDYEANEVVLYVQRNRRDLESYINKNVKVVFNEDTTHYYRHPIAIIWQVLHAIAKLFKLSAFDKIVKEKLSKHILKRQMHHELMINLKNEKFDVAIAYQQGYQCELVAKYINAKKKIVFYHSSTDDFHDLHLELFSNFNYIVAVSAQVKSMLALAYPNFIDKFRIVDNYVDFQFIRKQADAFPVTISTNKQDTVILCSCGRFSYVKGFDIAVLAAHILQQKGYNFHWFFVGDGPNRNELECQISMYNLQHYITITGFVNNPYPYMNFADFYVQPSREDAQPLSIIEAQILAKPVISTKTMGGKSLIVNGTTGILTDIDDLSLAKSIIDLMQNPQLLTSIKNSLQKIDYSLSNDVFIKAWNELLIL